MNRLKHLLQSPHISVLRFDHQPDFVHHDPEEEVCQDYAIHFVEVGSFQLTAQKESSILSTGSVFMSWPGAVHSYRHTENMPSDVCLSVIYSRRFIEEAGCGDRLLPHGFPTVLPPTNRLTFLRRRLAKLASAADTLALESWACELISAVRVGGLNKKLYRARQLDWYAERVAAAQELLENRYAESLSLASLAGAAGMSLFQFARVFRELTGLPPHRYLLRVRLERAAKMILEGKPVTEACFDVGFSNLSHFTRSFRRRFGYAPSSLKSRQVKDGRCLIV